MKTCDKALPMRQKSSCDYWEFINELCVVWLHESAEDGCKGS